MNEPDPFDTFASGIRDGIKTEVATVEPGYDLEPKLIMEGGDGSLIYAPLGHLMGDDGAKDFLGEVAMPSLIRGAEASRAALLCFAWGAIALDEEANAAIQKWRDDHDGSLEGGPGVVEIAQVWVGDFTGQFAMWTAEVIRDEEGRPSLNDWELSPMGKVAWFGDHVSGRLISPAMSALVGSPTPLEIRTAVKAMSQDDDLREAFEAVYEELGVDPSLGVDAVTEAQKQAMLRDPRFADLRDRIKERAYEILGHPSPVVRKGGEAGA